MDEEFADLLLREGDAGKTRDPNAQGSKVRRPRNYDVLLALEHALVVGCNLSLATFQYSRPPQPLLRSERRYFSDYEWPYPRGDFARKRACIEDTYTGCRKWEVPLRMVSGEYFRRALHLFVDQCSMGWHNATFLFAGKAQLRGTYSLDRIHTQVNLFGAARAEAGLGLLHLEWLTALNATKGPNKTHGHMRTLRAVGQLLFSSIDESHPMCLLLYEEIARDLDLAATTSMWTPEHQQLVFLRQQRSASSSPELALLLAKTAGSLSRTRIDSSAVSRQRLSL